MAALRNLSMGILRLQKHVNIAKPVRHYAAKQHMTLSFIGI
jgi:hypothetical protein